MKRYTRREVFSLRDDDLIDYYDRCIEEFTKLNRKYEKLLDLKKQSDALEGRSNIIFLALFFVSGATIYQITHLIFSYNRITNSSSISRDLLFQNVRRDWGILAVLIVLLILVFFYIVTRRKYLKKRAEEVANKFQNLDRSIQGDIIHAKGNLYNAYVLFSGPQDLKYIRILRDLVVQGRARTHQEAANIASDEIHHMEDSALKKELILSVNKVADAVGNDRMNRFAQGSNIISGIKPTLKIFKRIASFFGWCKE